MHKLSVCTKVQRGIQDRSVLWCGLIAFKNTESEDIPDSALLVHYKGGSSRGPEQVLPYAIGFSGVTLLVAEDGILDDAIQQGICQAQTQATHGHSLLLDESLLFLHGVGTNANYFDVCPLEVILLAQGL